MVVIIELLQIRYREKISKKLGLQISQFFGYLFTIQMVAVNVERDKVRERSVERGQHRVGALQKSLSSTRFWPLRVVSLGEGGGLAQLLDEGGAVFGG